ncbi:MAG: hypothetical protein GY943_09895, partial [Chloroflexi bacterium]|nr:hypothetical protein [Chloroflexota bacterium]
SWEESAHGNALTNEGFQQMWQEQGEPASCLQCHTTGYNELTGTWDADGVTCESCHYLAPNNPAHPDQVMLTHDSADKCGECHVETYAEWQISEHSQDDMTCVNCHNPHSNSIKKDDLDTMCQTCHTNEGYYYSMTEHGQGDLLCTDCHLRISNTPMGEGHGQRHHTFAVDLDTCNECHAEEMHYPAKDEQAGEVVLISPTNGDSGTGVGVHLEPTSASPFNFAILAAVIGLAFGFVGTPLFENLLGR